MRWSQEADSEIFRILLRLLQEQSITIPYADIAAEFGRGTTATAIKHRFQKFRETKYVSENNESQGEGGGVEGPSPPPSALATGGKKPRTKGGSKLRVEKVIEGRVGKPSGKVNPARKEE